MMISTDVIANQGVSSPNLVTQLTICALMNFWFLLCSPISISSCNYLDYCSLLYSQLHGPGAQELEDTTDISVSLCFEHLVAHKLWHELVSTYIS